MIQKETIDPEAVAAYKEIAEAKGEAFKLPAGYVEPEEPKQPEPKVEEIEEDPESDPEPEVEPEVEPEAEVEEEPEAEEEPKEKPEEEKALDLTEEDIRALAIEESLNMEEAKERLTARMNLVQKYQNDPKKMAKALQSTQSSYDKIKNELAQLQSTPKYDENILQREVEKASIPAEIERNKDELIAKVREMNPKKTENMDDQDIVQLLVAKAKQDIDVKYEKTLSEMKVKASERRVDALKQISEADKEFIPDVKKMLEQAADNQVASPHFDIQDFVKYVRGEKYTSEYVEKLKKEYYEKGKSEAKILGEKRPVTQPTTKTVVKPEGTARNLNQAQKNRAIEMFPDDSPEVAMKSFKEVFAKQLKENPNFVS